MLHDKHDADGKHVSLNHEKWIMEIQPRDRVTGQIIDDWRFALWNEAVGS